MQYFITLCDMFSLRGHKPAIFPAGEGRREIRNIEIAIRNIGLNSKETAKSRHNGGGGGGEERDPEHRNSHPEHRAKQ